MALTYVGSATGLTGTSTPSLGATINTPAGVAVGDLVISTINFGPNTPAMFSSLYVTVYLLSYAQSGSFDNTVCISYIYDGSDYFITYEYLSGPQHVENLAVATTMAFHSDTYPNRAVATCVVETLSTGGFTPSEGFITDDIHVYCIGATDVPPGSFTAPSGTTVTQSSFGARDDGLGDVEDQIFGVEMAMDLEGPNSTQTVTWGVTGNDIHTWGFRISEIEPADHSTDRPTDDRAVASGLDYLVYTDPGELLVNKYNWSTGESSTLAGGSFQSLTDITLFYNTQFAYVCDYVGQKIFQVNSAVNASPVTTEIFDYAPLYRFPFRVDACTGTTPNELYVLDISFSELGVDPTYTNLTKITFDGSNWVSQILLSIPRELPLDLAVAPNGVVWILTENDNSPFLYRWTPSGKIAIDAYGSTPNANGSNPRRLTAKADGSAYVTFGYAEYQGGIEV